MSGSNKSAAAVVALLVGTGILLTWPGDLSASPGTESCSAEQQGDVLYVVCDHPYYIAFWQDDISSVGYFRSTGSEVRMHVVPPSYTSVTLNGDPKWEGAPASDAAIALMPSYPDVFEDLPQ